MIGRKRLAITAALLGSISAGAVAMTTLCGPSAFANDCAAKCQAQENSCRRATKDSPSCSEQMTRCLQGCRQQR
jgi:hypothetical protein